MEIVIITFRLEGINELDYELMCEHVAPAFAAVEGLQSKVWLAGRGTDRFGGVYTFAAESDVERFLASQLFVDVRDHPNLDSVEVRRFEVMDEPTRITRGPVAAPTA